MAKSKTLMVGKIVEKKILVNSFLANIRKKIGVLESKFSSPGGWVKIEVLKR
jgi:hypothetical protein